MTNPTIATTPPTHATAATLTVEQAEQQVHDANLQCDVARAAYAAAVESADGLEMWRCRQQAVEAAGQLNELRAAAAIRRQQAVEAALESKLAQAQQAVAAARSAVEAAADTNLAAGGRFFDLRRAHTVAAAQLGTLARDVMDAQTALQAAEQALKALIAETTKRIG